MKNRPNGKKLMTMLTVSLLLTIFTFTVKAGAAVVVIDPGHGGTGLEGCGAIYAPYIEKALTLDLANQLAGELGAAGVSVYMTHSSDQAMSLPQRAAYAQSVGAKLMVSIHFNASGPHDKTGSEVWTSAFGNHYKVGSECGSQVLSQLTALGLSSKGVKTKMGSQGDYYGVIRYSTSLGVPTIIIEHCFLDHPYDRSVLERVGTSGFAHADAVGIINFLTSSTGQALMNGSLDVSPVNQSAAAAATLSAATPAASTVNLSANFTPAQWSWLLSQWAYTGNAEGVIASVPLEELKALVAEQDKGNL